MLEAARETACRANLQQIYMGLGVYHSKYGRLPQNGGARFFCALITDNVWENNPENARRLTCPSVEYHALEGLEGRDEVLWFAGEGVIDGTYSAYAGRDVASFPIREFPGSGRQALVACDNDGGMNHSSGTCVLWDSGEVTTLSIEQLQAEGVIDYGDDYLPVGPDSPIEELQKLSLD